MKNLRKEYEKWVKIDYFLRGFLLASGIAAALFLITYKASAQNAIGFAMYQDVRLALDNDDGHGNKGLTPDIITKITLQGSERAIGHSFYGVSYEWADLFGGEFHRYAVNGGYTFTNFPIPGTNIKYSASLFAGAGLIHRHGWKPFSPEAGGIITFKITDNLKWNNQAFWMLRTDLPNKKFGFNVSTGLQFDISTDYLKVKNGKSTRF
jgi:hypothetical protein